VQLWPSERAGHKLVVSIVNDASDPSVAARSVSRPVNEEKVDIIVGSSLTPTSLAMVPRAAQARTAMISLATSASIVEPMDERRKVQPGTEAFREAMRDGMEQTRDLTTTTVHVAFSERNHSGMDQRSQILVVIKGGKWVLAD
jgi:substrate-binding family protein